jgi:hypothetical protein
MFGLLIWSLAGSLACRAAGWNADPETLVRSFQKDDAAFNKMAYPIADLTNENPVVLKAWAELRKRYFVPGFRGLPGSYISQEVNRTLEEKIELIASDQTTAVVLVTKRIRNTIQNIEGTEVTEYHLVRQNDRWYFEHVYVIVRKKRHELYRN